MNSDPIKNDKGEPIAIITRPYPQHAKLHVRYVNPIVTTIIEEASVLMGPTQLQELILQAQEALEEMTG